MLDAVIVEPKEPVFGTIICLHGLGASGDDLASIAPHMQLLDVLWVFPHAPERPITIFQGESVRAWYDITTLGESSKRESYADVLASEIMIQELIAAEVEKGIPTKNIVLMGFSQGAAMALHVSHRLEQKLLGVIIMSGYLLKPDVFGRGHLSNRNTPFYFFHGSKDFVVPMRRGEEAYERTRGVHPVCRWKEYPIGHEICLEELRQVRFALHKHFNHIRNGGV
jgi:phospholipase/carboxylesterase